MPVFMDDKRLAKRLLAGDARAFDQFFDDNFARLYRFAMARLSDEARRDLASVEGEEHLEQARQDSPSGGVVVLTAHYGAWELLVSIMASRGWPIAVVRRARSNRLFEQVLGTPQE